MNGKEEFLLGIIDFLQEWNFKKIAAQTVKRIQNEKDNLSSIAPNEYAERFEVFISNAVQ